MTTAITNWTAIRELADDLELLATDVARSSTDHGPRHWRDVARVGLALWADGVDITLDDLTVVLLFAMLHDTQRHNEFEDPQHGQRAADVASRLGNSGRLLDWLDGDRAVRLHDALIGHDQGVTMDPYDDVAIATCWDADRLTLWRVGITPDAKYLSTSQAKAAGALIASHRLVTGTEDPTWEEIITAYENLSPLDLLDPLIPARYAKVYRDARRRFGDNLHPDLHIDDAGPLTVVRNRFVQDIYMGPASHPLTNVRYMSTRAAADEMWAEDNFAGYVLLHAKPYRLDAIHEVAPFVLGEQLAELVGDHWTHSENIWQQQAEWADLWIEARDGGHLEHAMDEDERTFLADLPTTVRIYRGYNVEGRDSGLSWTLDQEQAEWFARRWASQSAFGSHVAEGTALRESILAYFSGEHEIVILPEDVNVERIYEVASSGEDAS